MPTKIEWTEETWSPVTGCTPVSEGCRNCYAKRMAHRLAGRFGYPEAPHEFDVTLHPDKLDQPFHWKWKKPRKIFVCSMGDLFHEDVPDGFIAGVWMRMLSNPKHTFQVLTKRPERMSKLVPELFKNFFTGTADIAENIWLGVTAENQQAADERIPWLLKTPAAVRFVSVEPMLGPVDMWEFATREETFGSMYDYRGTYEWYQVATGIKGAVKYHEGIDWVICGGETGPGAREMEAGWAIDLCEQCDDAGVPFFFKRPGDGFQGDINNLPMIEGEFVRQYPKEIVHASI